MLSIYGFHHKLQNRGCLLIGAVLRGGNFVFEIVVEVDRFRGLARVECILCLS